MKKIEITIQTDKKGFVIENIEPVSKKNMLLMNLKIRGRKNEQK